MVMMICSPTHGMLEDQRDVVSVWWKYRVLDMQRHTRNSVPRASNVRSVRGFSVMIISQLFVGHVPIL